MRNVLSVALVAASIFASACAFAQAATPAKATNLCPAGTQTVAGINVKGTDMGFPPEEGAEGESAVQVWTIDPAQQFTADCNPDLVGFKNIVQRDVPKGSSICTFVIQTGVLTCKP